MRPAWIYTTTRPSIFCIGDRNTFAIEAGFTTLPLRKVSGSVILETTEGYLTFIVGGVNTFEVNSDTRTPDVLTTHTPVFLSMFLEWIYFDKAYMLTSLERCCFSDLPDAETSPPIGFHLEDHEVIIQWDLTDSTRGGCAYTNPTGKGRVKFEEYLACLAMVSDMTIAATDWRAIQAGCQDEWRQWLSGYQSLREEFREYVSARI